jgi:hypothetical protein
MKKRSNENGCEQRHHCKARPDRLVPRIDITLETHVHFVENTHLPDGVGEPCRRRARNLLCDPRSHRQTHRALPVDPQLLKA